MFNVPTVFPFEFWRMFHDSLSGIYAFVDSSMAWPLLGGLLALLLPVALTQGEAGEASRYLKVVVGLLSWFRV